MINTIVQELKRAINTEIDGYDFYIAAAESVDDEKGKKLFRQLAKEELDHLKALKSLSIALEKEGKWIEYEEAVDLGISILEEEKVPLFPNKELIPKLLGPNATDIDALNFAIKIEAEAIGYYSAALKNSSNKEEESFFSALRNIERAHLKLLRWELDSLVKKGYWSDFQDFTAEE
jgi:rubrerythrin